MGELDILHTHFFDGMIAILYHPESLAKIKEIRTLPVITINCPIDELQNIYSDHKQGIRLAFDYLISRGHKKIGLFQRASVPWGDTQRREAYKECLEKHNIPFDENLIQVQKDSSLVEAMARICRVGPTALIACGEDAPLEVMYALNLLNKRVPDDISVISFENNNLSPYLNPPHTTVCQHLDEIGRAAVEEIENIIDGKTGNLSDKIIKNTLIERASVRTLK